MPRVAEQVLIPHSADNLYELVRDVRQYPSFIKWISALKVSEEQGDPESAYACFAKVTVHFKGFEERFSTRVTGDPVARKVEAKLHRGPFRYLRNRWQFDPREDGRTRVHCFIDYDFMNPMLSLLARSNSRLAVERIIDAFQDEADRRYPRIGS